LSFDFAAPKAGEGTFGGFRAPRTQVPQFLAPHLVGPRRQDGCMSLALRNDHAYPC